MTTGRAIAGQIFQLTCQLDGIFVFILHMLLVSDYQSTDTILVG